MSLHVIVVTQQLQPIRVEGRWGTRRNSRHERRIRTALPCTAAAPCDPMRWRHPAGLPHPSAWWTVHWGLHPIQEQLSAQLACLCRVVLGHSWAPWYLCWSSPVSSSWSAHQLVPIEGTITPTLKYIIYLLYPDKNTSVTLWYISLAALHRQYTPLVGEPWMADREVTLTTTALLLFDALLSMLMMIRM